LPSPAPAQPLDFGGQAGTRVKGICVLGMKPNYNQQRAERDRLKRLKKEEKAREQEDARARRRAEQAAEEGQTAGSTSDETPS
jgi:hypothetical protein